MTTIVYRNGVLAGDTAVFDRGTYCGQTDKVHKNSAGWLMGACGALGEMSKFRDWFMAGMEGPSPEVKNDQSEFLIVDPTGVMIWYGHTDCSAKISGEYAAIGSGFEVAMGALAAGADAYEAATIAATLNNLSRLPISSVTLDSVPNE